MASHKNKDNSQNMLPPFSQQLFLKTGRSIEVMARFIKELGTDPDVQEVADEIPSLHRLLKLWTDPSALLADSAPDVEAIQEKMKKLEQVHQACATKLEAIRQQRAQVEAKNAANIDQIQVYKDVLAKFKKEKQAEIINLNNK
jgi:antirestriction protein ArdC